MELLIKAASVETDQELKFPWGHELIIAVGEQWRKLKLPQEFSSCLSVRLQELLPDQGLGSALTPARPQPRHHGGQTAAGFHQNSSQQQRRGSCSHCSRPVSEPPLFSPHLTSLLRRFYLFTLSSLITSQAAQVARQRLPGAGWLSPEEPAADPLHQEVPQQRRVQIQRVQELLGAVQTGTTIPEYIVKRTLWVERRKKKHFYYHFIN